MDSKVIKSALSFLSSSVIVQMISFFSQIILMRNLSVDDFGKYSLSFEALSMCNMVVTSSFRNFYMRQYSLSVDIRNLIMYQIMYGSLWCCISSIIIGLTFTLGFKIIVYMTISLIFSSIILPIWVELLLDNKRNRIIFKDITYSIITFLFIVVYIKLGYQEITFLIVSIFIVNAIVSLLFFWNKNLTSCITNIKIPEGLEGSILPFFGVFIVNTIYNKIGVTFLNYTSSIQSVAIYLATFKFITPIYFVQTSLISSILPKFKSDRDFIFNFKFFIYFAFPGLLITILLPFILPFVVDLFGITKYSSISHYLIFGSPIIFISFVYGALSNYLSIRGGQFKIITTNLIAISVYLFSLIIFHFINFKIDPIETCLSFFVITESFICFMYYILIKKTNIISLMFLFSPILVILYEFILLLR